MEVGTECSTATIDDAGLCARSRSEVFKSIEGWVRGAWDWLMLLFSLRAVFGGCALGRAVEAMRLTTVYQLQYSTVQYPKSFKPNTKTKTLFSLPGPATHTIRKTLNMPDLVCPCDSQRVRSECQAL